MINLIPPPAKRKLRYEYWVRAVSVWFTIWSVALFAGACILLPAYVLIGSQVSVYQVSATAASEKVVNYETVSASLEQANLQARSVIDEANLPLFSEYISLFEAQQGSGVAITEMRLSREVTGVAPVTVSGTADDRQSLASFRDRLLAIEEVTSVDLPISNLARDKDISFTLTVALRNNTGV